MTAPLHCGAPMLRAWGEQGCWYVCAACGHETRAEARQPAEPAPTTDGQGTALERAFARAWALYAPDMPELEREAMLVEGRGYRVDFCHRTARVVVECEGMDHRRTETWNTDVEKYNLLVAGGWRLFRCTSGYLRRHAEEFVRMVRQAIVKGGENA